MIEKNYISMTLVWYLSLLFNQRTRDTDAFWGEHPFDGDMILIKNNQRTRT